MAKFRRMGVHEIGTLIRSVNKIPTKGDGGQKNRAVKKVFLILGLGIAVDASE